MALQAKIPLSNLPILKKKLIEQAIQNITLETYKSTFEHTLKIESNYWENDGLNIIPTISQFIINTQDFSSDSD